MSRFKANLDPERMIPPAEPESLLDQEVLGLFEDNLSEEEEREFWRRASMESLRKVWDNPEDEIFNKM